MRRERTGWLLVLAALVYASWMLEGPLGAGLDVRTSYVSELGSPGRPARYFFRGADLATGVLVIAWTLSARRTVLGANRRIRIPLAVFGLATMVDALCPMSCAPSLDAACRAREAAGQVPWTHLVHSGSSSVASIALWVVTWTLMSAQPWKVSFTGILNRTLWVLAVVFTLATIWLLVDVALVEFVHHPRTETTIGISQRVSLTCSSLWLAVTGLRAVRAHDASGVDQPT